MESKRQSQLEPAITNVDTASISGRSIFEPLRAYTKGFSKLALLAVLASACSPGNNDADTTQSADSFAGDAADLPNETVMNNTICAIDQQPLLHQKTEEVIASGALNNCIPCHSPKGIGWKPDSKDPSKTIGWERDFSSDVAKRQLSYNSMIRVAAKRTPDGRPWIFAHTQDKGGNNHGGGLQNFDGQGGAQTVQVQQWSDEASQWVKDLGKTDVSQLTDSDYPAIKADCDYSAFTEDTLFNGVKLRSLPETLNKFYTDVCGRPPSAQEANIKDEAQLQQLVISAMDNSPGYMDFLRTIVNDQTLLRGLAKDGVSIKNLGTSVGIDMSNYDHAVAADLGNIRFAWIAKNHRNIKEWAMGNYFLDPGVKSSGSSDDVMDHLKVVTSINDDLMPLTGFLTDGFQIRFPSTPTNVHRGQVYIEFKLIFDFDILSKGSRKQLPAGATDQFPTNTLDGCTQCHIATPMDLYARLHAKFDYKTGKFLPTASEPTPISLVNNAIYGHQLPHNSTTGLRTGITLLTSDPDLSTSDPNYDPKRPYPYARSIIKLLYQGLIQRKPQVEPKLGDANFNLRMQAFKVENDAIDKWALILHQNNYNVNIAAAAIVSSRFYRATEIIDVNGDLTNDEKVEKAHIGATLAPVHVLANRLSVLLGPDAKKSGLVDKVLHQYNMELMDIDSSVVVVRSHDPTSAYELRLDHLALNDVGKLVVADMAKAPGDRSIFQYLNDWNNLKLESPIEIATGEMHPEIEAKYRNTIAQALTRSFHKNYSPDDAEVTEWLNKWIDMFKIVNKSSHTDSISTAHQVPGMNSSDPYAIIRTWEAWFALLVQGMKFNFTQNENTPRVEDGAQEIQLAQGDIKSRLVTTFSRADLLNEAARFHTVNDIQASLKAKLSKAA